MCELQPFKAILYNTKKINISDVVAPPYDVISAQQQNALYERSEHNVVRLILGKEEHRYEAAKQYLDKWCKSEILLQDEQPAIYVLTQTFMLPDKKQVTRKGFIAACKLEELGKGSVLPHEKTLAKPKEDRLNLFKTARVMFSQIFSTYNDPGFELNDALNHLSSSKPYIEVEFENVLNRLWKLTDETKIQQIAEFFKDKKVLIADGHHRYETALAYRDIQREANPSHAGSEAYNFVPMFLTNTHDPGLIVFPTHRIVHSLPEIETGDLIQKLKEFFQLTIYSNQEQLLKNLPLRKNNFGVILPAALGYILIELKNNAKLKEFNIPEPLLKLDVTILHSVILKHILGISEEAQLQKINLDYVKDSQQAIDLVKEGKAQAAFLLNPTPVEQVWEVAEAGYVLPQKSTYFFPKLLSGLVTYSFANE